MTTAVFEKRLRALEEEVKELKQVTTKRLALFPTRVPIETKKKSKLSTNQGRENQLCLFLLVLPR